MIHFCKHRTVFFMISACILSIGVIFLFINGMRLDVPFKGGTILKYTYTGTMDIEQAENVVEQIAGVSVNGQLQTSMGKQLLIFRLADAKVLTSQEQEAVTAALNSAFPSAQLNVSETLTVEPSIGKNSFRNGIIAIILSFLIIPVFAGLRYNEIDGLSAGTVAFITLTHNALIATMAFIMFKIPINSIFITVILTIIGLSIADIMIVYDRIRENQRLLGDIPADELADRSITQSLMRIININIAVFLSIAILYIFAEIYTIEPVRSFALPMMFGTVSNCYSAIFIAGPLWAISRSTRSTDQ